MCVLLDLCCVVDLVVGLELCENHLEVHVVADGVVAHLPGQRAGCNTQTLIISFIIKICDFHSRNLLPLPPTPQQGQYRI
jgi:hypothetical protein